MSDIDRAGLRRLLEEARSKLPWQMGTEEGCDYGIIYGAPYEREGGGYLLIPTVTDPNYGEDAELIVAAVNALPDLLDALEKAEKHRDSLAATLIEVQREKLALEHRQEAVLPDLLTQACTHCDGGGFEPMGGRFKDSHACSVCGGEGEIRSYATERTTP